ncbi:MAG: glycosyltransferase family 4 protein [Spirochaetota bacterium]|nr:glycosyltransferase family 4 protein [Spirochaetota bacterium]
MKKNILHITPHLGGGVGRVILNYLSKVKNDPTFNHKVICLDYANENAVKSAKNINLSLWDKMSDNKQKILDLITQSDIILIHWWNHPLLFDFLVKTELPPCRLIMWSHISGFHPPYVFTLKVLIFPDLFVFTTPVSHETKEVQKLTDKQKKHLRVVWSTGGVEHVMNVKHKSHKGFNIGYIGTVDYCKIHPNFLTICDQIKLPDIKFIVCGGSSEIEIMKEAEQLGINEKFHFTGLVSDIIPYLSIFDVFGYPLSHYHYGTCDQVLAESMASGVVPIVLNNKMEQSMIQDGQTGIIAQNETEYIKAIEKLYHDKKLREILSKNAKEYATKAFSLEIMIRDWEKIFEELLNFPKTGKKWDMTKTISEISAKDVFLESLGNYGKNFINYCNAKTINEKKITIQKIKKLLKSPLWQAKTRGTVYHYNYFFKNDKYLLEWAQLMNQNKL